MSAGTLTLVNNSVNVVGVGTAFTTDLKVNDFVAVVVGGATYTMAVKSITNATNLVVTRPYAGPSQSGAAWSAVPNGTMVGITVKVAEDTSYTMRMYVNEATNWMNLLTVNDNVTVTAPDGSTFTGPSWKYLSDNAAIKSGGSVPVSQGGTGSTSAQGARTNLGLGTVATYTVATSTSDWNANRVLYTGCWGIGAQDSPIVNHADAARYGGIVNGGGEGGVGWADNDSYSPALVMNRLARYFSQIQVTTGNKLAWRIGESGVGWKPWRFAWDSINTTVDSNGFIKRASPVVQIFKDGSSKTNDESEGAMVNREGVGVYRISGVLGMNSDRSWGGNGGGVEVPKDINGQPRVWVDYDIDSDGSIILRTYHRTHPDAPAFARNLIGTKDDAGNFTETVLNGEPIDIPDDVFISVRVEMPADSVYNLSLAQHRD